MEFVPLVLLVIVGGVTSEVDYQVVVDKAILHVKEALKTYPHVHLHFSMPEHEDLSRMELWIRETVPVHVKEFFHETIDRCKNIASAKERTLKSLEALVKEGGFTETSESIVKVKSELIELMESMMEEMNDGKGSLDFELDGIARDGLGDLYFFVKAKISSASYIQQLKECQSDCGFKHFMIIRQLTLLRFWNDEVTKKVVGVLLGLPGLDSRYIKPQLLKMKSSLSRIEDQDLEFLVSFGEWMNDVLNSGLIVLQKPFADIRGQLLELLGSTKDKAVPRIQSVLQRLDPHKESLGFIWKDFNTVLIKYFGRY